MDYNTHGGMDGDGVGKRRVEKKRFFFAGLCEIPMVAVILFVLLLPDRGRVLAAAENGTAAPEPEVRLSVRLKGAEKLDEIIALRERVAELETLERKRASENASLIAERNLLRQELFDAINQLEMRNADFRRLELSVAGLLAAGRVPGAPAREDRLVEAIGEITKSGRELAVLAVEFRDETDAVLKQLPAGSLEAARLRLKGDELLNASRKFSAMAGWELARKTVDRCRILAVNHDLGAVVLPVGAAQGVFNGLIFHVPGKSPAEPAVSLRVVSTRALTAAAVVTDGDIRALSPGAEAVTDLQTLINREQ